MKRFLRWPIWVVLAVLLITTSIVTVPLFHSSKAKAARASSGGPTITATPNTIHVGMKISVTGQGFAANDQVAVYLGDYTNSSNQIATLACDSSGNCSGTSVNLLAPTPQGVYTLYGVGQQPNEIAQTSITYKPFVPAVSGGPGDLRDFSGTSFAANETVKIYWGTAKGTLVGSATADAYGNITFQVTSPTGLADGSYPITLVRSQQKPLTVTTHFRIVPPVIKLSKGGIRSGQYVDVSLFNFQGSEPITISWDANGGQQIVTTTADAYGSASLGIAPPSAPKGSYTITATGNNSGLHISHALNIGPGIILTPTNDVNPGGSITVIGGGFTTGETISLYLQKPGNGSVSVTTDSAGGFTATLTAPKQYSTSTTYYVYAVNANGSEKAKVALYFTLPQINITDIYGNIDYLPYGSASIVSGQGFLSGESVDIYWNYQGPNQLKVTTVTAASDGTFTVTVTIPSSPLTGFGGLYMGSPTTVAAIGSTSQLQASQQINVYAGMSISPDYGPEGTVVTISGGSFAANDQIKFVMSNELTEGRLPSSGTVIGTATADSTGVFTATITMATAPTDGRQPGIYAEGHNAAVAGFSFTVPLNITPTTGTAGTSITVSGTDRLTNFPILIYWYDPQTNALTNITTVTTAGDGSFTTTITAPANLVSGRTYYIQTSYGQGQYLPIAESTFTAQ